MLCLAKRPLIFVAIMFVGDLLSISAYGQLGTGTVNGTVFDSTGAVIPGTSLTLANVETNEKRTIKTNADGHYSVPEVPYGRYSLTAEAPGFGSVTRENIEVSVGAQLTVNLTLAVGGSSISVEVQSTVEAQVNSTSGEQSTLVDQKQMRDLPLNGRNFEQLILLSPGVQPAPAATQSSAYGRSPSYSISGSRPEGQLLLLDGANIQGFWNRGTGASIIGTSLGVEAIAEFQTVVGIYGAQFGGNGSVINAVTKSGTNKLHGSAYDFLRNSVFDARNYFDPLSGPPSFRRNQFGGSLGGPIRKDKTFFFINYEGLRQQLGATNIANVPDQNAHNGLLPCAIAAGYVCGTNGLANVGVSTKVAPILALFPLPNGNLFPGTGSGQFTGVANKPANENYVHGRLDEVFSAKDTFSIRYVSDNGDLIDPFPSFTTPGFPEVSLQRNRFLTLENKVVVSPKLLNTQRIHFTRSTDGAQQQSLNPAYAPFQFVPNQQYGNLNLQSLNPSGLPNLGFGPGFQTPFRQIQNKIVGQDDTYVVVKSHQIQFGIDVTHVQTTQSVNIFGAGQFTFPTLSSFLTATPSLGIVALPGSDDSRTGQELDISPYVQDDWKVNSKLSLNLGLRYEFVTNPTEKDGKFHAIINPATDTGFTSVPHAFGSNPSLKNIDPRFGFSYTPFGQKTALRGGFGLFHNPIGARSYLTFYNVSAPYSLRTILNPSFPSPFSGGLVGAPSLNSGIYYDGTTTPYQMESSLGIQQQLNHDTVLTLSYVGNEGRHLFAARDGNPVVAATCPCTDPANPAAASLPVGTTYFPVPTRGYIRANKNFGSLNYSPSSGTSHYNSLQITLAQQLSHSIRYQINYTWSKAMDYSSLLNSVEEQNGTSLIQNPYNVTADYGPSAYDMRHVGTANVIYVLPSLRENRLLSGWEATLLAQIHTGSPYNVIAGFDRANINNPNDLQRLNQVGDPNRAGTVPANPTCAAPTRVHTASQWYNPCAFTLQPAGTFGNERRDQIYAPGLQNYDVAFIKNTRIPEISEDFSVEFRAELFNIFNHTDLGFPNFTAITSATGGYSSAAGSIISTTETSRQVQFALKFLF
jgi:hypothetical protein